MDLAEPIYPGDSAVSPSKACRLSAVLAKEGWAMLSGPRRALGGKDQEESEEMARLWVCESLICQTEIWIDFDTQTY